MADDQAAAAVVASSPPLPPRPDTPLSNASSPLTEVEDKDGDPDEMELDGPAHKSSPLSNVNMADLEDDDEDDHGLHTNQTRATRSQRAKVDAASDNDDESALSEVEPDVNDSEAETERLFATPTKSKNIKDGADGGESSPESFTVSPTKRLALQQSAAARDRTFQASPSKLKQQLRADSDDRERHSGGDNNGALVADADDSDENNEADGEEEAATDDRENTRSSRRRSLAASKDAKSVADQQDDAGTPLARGQRSSSDTRKRKRSPTTDPSESDQPLRKRAGANAEASEEADTNGAGDAADAAASADRADRADRKNDGDHDHSAEGTASDTFRARRSKRGSAKRRGNKDSDDEGDGHDDVDDERDGAVDDEAAGAGDDEPEGDIDEEAEAAHRNEEELERKKAALDNLSAIEKQFASFRDKLYQERLDQLNHEEEMLQGDNPTHPEYLAMMQCIDERRDAKKRVVETELALNMQTLNRWAVARRSHIHGQYFQSIRESREMVLEELGRQWYQIQLQRRRHANTIPDYGLRFPTSKQQCIKDAVSYNTEVSILSGLAKYEGFPAAPTIRGASHNQVDDDLEAIARGRLTEPRAAAQPAPAPAVHAPHAHEQAQAQAHAHAHQVQQQQQQQQQQGNGAPFSNGSSSVISANAHSVHSNGHVAAAAHMPAMPTAPSTAPTAPAAPPSASTSTHAAVSYHSLGAAGQQFLANTPWANPHHPIHSTYKHLSPSQSPLHGFQQPSQSQFQSPSLSQFQPSPSLFHPRDELFIQRQQQAQQPPSGLPGLSPNTNHTNTSHTSAALPRPPARKPLPLGGSLGLGPTSQKTASASANAAAARNPPVPDFASDAGRPSSVPIQRETAAKVTA